MTRAPAARPTSVPRQASKLESIKRDARGQFERSHQVAGRTFRFRHLSRVLWVGRQPRCSAPDGFCTDQGESPRRSCHRTSPADYQPFTLLSRIVNLRSLRSPQWQKGGGPAAQLVRVATPQRQGVSLEGCGHIRQGGCGTLHGQSSRAIWDGLSRSAATPPGSRVPIA